MTHEADIVILGAGAAGTGAARRLAGTGLSVLLLEALPRPGGRAWTHQAPTQDAGGLALDLGCGWLHSGDRNPWTRIAEQAGFTVDRSPAAWGRQYGDLGIAPEDLAAANLAFEAWSERLANAPPASDCAADALVAEDARWTAYLQALSGYISGDEMERISARDYATYDDASTYINWRLPAGYGTLVTSSLPAEIPVHLGTPVEAIRLDGAGVALDTREGTLRCRAVLVTVSTHVLAGDTLRWPAALDPWRAAAARLPLGRDEKLFLEIVGDSPFEPETHLLGDLNDPQTGTYYIRPFGQPVIECFFGGAGARAVERDGTPAAFARAIDTLAGLFGASVRTYLRPLIASGWAGVPSIGGAYSHALPGYADARRELARPFDGRVFFAGEATHPTDFSTAHGAYLSGARAAEEALAALAALAPR
ncbi:FAD-dependent oxidoreductase [Ancylobacter sp. Lp-2]|uniref:flavin monoamine oxidase family protein n=1 Tax=Ancylobacter sp. Lp-2 TaxID=2881339 RepID=UPI001E63F9E5|nr:NAD(P)/FAD-dependent oxidoreductase [Ancylobacter sp. Lp-2]MCB4769094.1 FAD-dependent oxidoreductase [Ancylobacter sp. Lp-2]